MQYAKELNPLLDSLRCVCEKLSFVDIELAGQDTQKKAMSQYSISQQQYNKR